MAPPNNGNNGDGPPGGGGGGGGGRGIVIDGDNNSNILAGTQEDELIRGKNGDDLLFGAGGDDTLEGGKGNDTLIASEGPDLLDGGDDLDTVEYRAAATVSQAEIELGNYYSIFGYDISIGADSSTVVDVDLTDGATGTDILVDVEYAVFSDDDADGDGVSGLITVFLDGTNNAALAVKDALIGFDEDSIATITASQLLANDLEFDGEAIAIQSVDTSLTSGAILTTQNPDGTIATITYDPTSAYDYLSVGEVAYDTFEYTIIDPLGAGTKARVSLEVTGRNDAPVVSAIAQTVIPETTDTSAIAANIAVSFTDVDLTDTGHTAMVTSTGTSGTTSGLALDAAALAALVTPGVVTKASGSAAGDVTLAFSAASTDFDYLADGEQVTLNYSVLIDDQDGGQTAQAFEIVITGTNDVPQITVGAGDSASEGLTEADAGLSVSGTLSVADADLSDTVDATVLSVAASGTGPSGPRPDNATLLSMLSLGANPVIDGATTSGTIGWSFDSAPEAFDYLATGETLILEYTLEAADGIATDTQTVTITITGTNDAPVATDDVSAAGENDVQVLDILANDTDPDAADTSATFSVDSFEVTQVSGAPGAGTGSVSLDAFNRLVFNPSTDFDGLAAGDTATITVDYTMSDNEGDIAPVTLDFDALPAPDSMNGIFPVYNSVEEDGYRILAGVSSIDPLNTQLPAFGYVTTDSTALARLTAPATLSRIDGGLFDALSIDLEQLRSSYAGGTSVVFTGLLADGATVTETVEIDTDPGLQTHVFSEPFRSLSGLVVDTGLIASFDNIVLQPSSLSSSATAVFTVTGENDAPVADDFAFNITEDQVISGGFPFFSDVDLGDVVTIIAVDGDPGKVGPGQTTSGGAGLALSSEFSFIYNPTLAYNSLAQGETATDSFTYTVSDLAGATDTGTITINLTGVNDAPTLSAITPFAADEDVPLEISFDDLLAASNAADADGPIAGFRITSAIDGSLRYISKLDQSNPLAGGENGLLLSQRQQIFTAGTDGALERIVLPMRHLGAGTGDLTATILDGPGGTVLGTADLAYDFSSGFGTFTSEFDFSAAGIDLVEGEDYAFVISWTKSNPNQNFEGFYAGDTYAGGDLYYADQDRIVSLDLRFSTFVTPDNPIADPVSLISIGEVVEWTPDADLSGSFTAFEAVAVDEFGAESSTPVPVTIDVAPVNDAPVAADDALTGSLDVFVTNIFGNDEAFLNDGTGSFTSTGQVLPTNGQSQDVVLADIDGDGDLDAFVADSSGFGFRVWSNDGTGQFALTQNVQTGGDSYNVELADVDGDGDLDAFFSQSFSNPDRLWLNDGSGTFSDSGQTFSNTFSTAAVFGDFDGDGDQDILATDHGGSAILYTNDGSGNFTGAAASPTNILIVASGDIDGDGDLDLVTGEADPTLPIETPKQVWLNDGSGNFSAGQTLGLDNGTRTNFLLLADTDADGDLDLVASNGDAEGDTIWLNNGTGTFFDSGQSLGSTASGEVAFGDVDGDGDGDLVFAQSGAEAVWLNDGSGTFNAGGTFGSGNTTSIALGDLDGFSEDSVHVLRPLLNDSDVDSATLTIVEIDGQAVATGDTVVLASDAAVTLNADGSLTYDPTTAATLQALAHAETYAESFTYRISDGEDISNLATVSLEVTGRNDAPVVSAIAQTVIPETTDTSAIAANIAVSFTDVDLTDTGHTAMVTSTGTSGTTSGLALDAAALAALVTPGVVTKASGSAAGDVTLAFSAASTDFDYLADGEQVTLNYSVLIDDQDGGQTAQAFEIVITGTNDVPQITVGAGDSASEGLTEADAGLSVSGTLSVADADLSDTVDATVLSVAASGTGPSGPRPDNATLLSMLSLGANPVIDGATTSGTIGWSFDSAPEAFDYLATGETLILEYTLEAADGIATDTQTVTITITGTNDAPVATDDVSAAGENDVQVLDILANDTDPDAADTSATFSVDSFEVTQVSGAPGAGTGSVSLDAFNRLVFNPSTDFDGLAAGDTATITVDYTMSDNEGDIAPVTLDFDALPAPDSMNGIFPVYNSVEEDGYRILAGVSSIDPLNTQLPAFGYVTTDSTALARLTAPATLSRIDGGLFDALSIDLEQLRSSYAGGTSVVFTGLLADGATVTETVEIDTDPGLQTHVFSEPFRSLSGLVVDTGLIASFDNIVLQPSSLSSSATAVFTVTGENDAPVADDFAFNITEDQVISGGFPFFSDVDLGDVVTIIAVDGDPGKVGPGQTTSGGAGLALSSEFSFIYNPTLAYNSLAQGETATDSFTYTVSDLAGATDTGTITINLTGVNDAPTLSAITPFAADEDVPLEISFDDLLAASNAADADGPIAGFRITSAIDGSLRYISKLDQSNPLAGGENGLLLSQRQQIFTAGTDGALERIVLPMRHLGAGTGDLTATILDGPGGTVLGTADLAYDFSSGFGTFTSEFDFSAAGIDLVEGEDYAFVISWTKSNPNQNFEGFYAGDTYAGGDLYYADQDRIVSLDLRFSTFVTPDNPIADPVSLISIGEVVEWTPDADLSGSFTAFEAVAVDEFGAESSTPVPVTIDVAPVNDAPVAADDALTGSLDVFVTNIFGNDEAFLNDGTGSFTSTGQVLPTNGQSQDVVLADIDGDGDLDAFVADSSGFGFRVWSNDGTGQFALTQNVQTGGDSYNVELADVDGDGDLDAFFSQSFSNPDRLWLNDGSGTFSDSGQTFSNTFSTAAVFGDFDGDGDQDILATDHGGSAILYTNDGSGNFTGAAASPTNILIVASGDIDGDGDLDLVTGEADPTLPIETPKQVWLNDGSGNFSAGQTLGLDNGTRTNFLLLADTDADGDLDLVASNGDAEGDTIWLNNGTGTFFDSGQSLGSTASGEVAFGDVDGDGDGDLVFAQSGAEAVWLNDGSGTFNAGGTFGSGNTTSIALGDLDGFSEDSVHVLRPLLNDSDVDSATLTIVEIDGQAVATGDTVVLASDAAVTLNADGSLTYDPTTAATLQALAHAETYAESFTYRISDGEDISNLATVSLEVTGRNDAPSAVLVHSYNFDFGTAQDGTGNANGTLFGDATITNGVLSLDGDGDYVQLIENIIPTDGSAYSVALRAQQTSMQSTYVELISQGTSTTSDPYGFYIGHSPSGEFRFGDNYLTTGLAFPDDGLFHTYVLTSSVEDGTNFYLDGSLIFDDPDYAGPTANGTATRFGRQFDPFDEYFDGNIDDIRVYDGVLSQSDVSIYVDEFLFI